MNYAAAFRSPEVPTETTSSYGYGELTPELPEVALPEIAHPVSPWQELESAWGNDPAAWGGRSLGDIFQQGLSGAASNAGRAFFEDPYVQEQLIEFKEDCRTKAKVGITEWMDENKLYIAVGGAALILTNFLMLTLAVLPAVERAVRQRHS
jgi:hypothetical protein